LSDREIVIATSGDLMAALAGPDEAVIIATVKAIAADPERAASLCSGDGIDLFRELSRLYDRAPSQKHHAAYLFALLHLEDSRCLDLARRAFLEEKDVDTILLSARYLDRLPEGERVALLVPVVMGKELPVKVRAAANLLADCPNLPREAALRVALTTDHDCPLPELCADTVDAWQKELTGPYALTARRRLKAAGPGIMARLLSFREQLSPDILVWALRQLPEAECLSNSTGIQNIIPDARGEMLVAALECLERVPAVFKEERRISQFYTHPRAAVRKAAFLAGTGRLDWSAALGGEPDDTVRLAIVTRIGRLKDKSAVGQLLPLLEDRNWRIRSRVARTLADLFPESLDGLCHTLRFGSDTARAASIRALQILGLEDKIKEVLEGDS
jgi:hypothetical protein